MKLISHRGNIDGPNPVRENSPYYIMEAISMGYEVEIDIWVIYNSFYLGHDGPQYSIRTEWLYDKEDKLWIHCKNIEAMEWFNNSGKFNYFWHQEDTVTLTSKGYMWAYPGKQPIKNSIAVMPELYNDNLNSCIGICSDYIQNYKK